MNNKQRKEIIINAIKHITNAYQVKLIKGVWAGVNSKNESLVDALACVIIENDEKYLKEIIEDDSCDDGTLEMLAADILQTNEEWTDSFSLGFQNVPRNIVDGIPNETAYKLGKTISKETKPIAFHIFADKNNADDCICGDCYEKNANKVWKYIAEDAEVYEKELDEEYDGEE